MIVIVTLFDPPGGYYGCEPYPTTLPPRSSNSLVPYVVLTVFPRPLAVTRLLRRSHGLRTFGPTHVLPIYAFV